MKLLLTIPMLFSSVFLFQPGCGTRQVDCRDQVLTLCTIGYSIEEVAEVSVLRYETGSNFTKLADSTFFLLQRSQYMRDSDTIPLGGMTILNYDPEKEVATGLIAMTGHDYEIYIHKTGNRHRISDILDQGHYTEEMPTSSAKIGCYNFIESYKLDNVYTNHNHDDNVIYLKK